MSHSGEHGLIEFAAGAAAALEVDMGCAQPEVTSTASEIACTVPGNGASWSGVAGEAKATLFYRLWTLKEAFIEALRTGFSLDPSRIEVPRPMLEGERSAVFRFPHRPFDSF